jgi:hypothetical protein
MFLTIVLVLVVSYPIRRAYRTEQANALSGEIHPITASATAPVLQYGTSKSHFVWEGDPNVPMYRFFADGYLKLELENGEILVTTQVRDKYGNVVLEMDKNVWRVSGPPISWDKNYTSDALEVQDRRGHVVFQMHLFPDRVQIKGEWHNEQGGGIAFSQEGENGTQILIPDNDKSGFDWDTVNIDPIFEYPSKDHWAEWRRPSQK